MINTEKLCKLITHDIKNSFMEPRFANRAIKYVIFEDYEKYLKDANVLKSELTKEEWYEYEHKDYTEENVIQQLLRDADFGLEKAEGQRGMSASMMFDVVSKWLQVLEMSDEFDIPYNNYGSRLFTEVLKKFGGENE